MSSQIYMDYPNLSAVIIFHHEWPEVLRLCQEFRAFYPHGEIILARDHLEPILPKFLMDFNPKLVQSFSCMQKLVELNFNLKDCSSFNVGQRMRIVMDQLERLATVARVSSHDYCLALEHDAKIRGRIPIVQGADIESLTFNKYPIDFLNCIEDLSGRKFPLDGWGFVVGTFRSSAAIQSFEWAECNSRILEKLVSEQPSMVYLDFLFPIVGHLAGFSVQNNNLTTECKRDRLWRFRRTPLLHQYTSGSTSSHRALASLKWR